MRERGLFGSYSLSLDHQAIPNDSKGSLQWLVGLLGRINRVFPTFLPKIKRYHQGMNVCSDFQQDEYTQ